MQAGPRFLFGACLGEAVTTELRFGLNICNFSLSRDSEGSL
jgi:hypothetical protein